MDDTGLNKISRNSNVVIISIEVWIEESMKYSRKPETLWGEIRSLAHIVPWKQ